MAEGGQPLDIIEKDEFEETFKKHENQSDEFDNNIAITVHPSAQSEGRSLEDRFSQLEVFKKPLCLISTDEHGRLQIKENVLSQIKQIDVPLNIVGVCGLYRSGKSYLMNRLVGEKKGFDLGATTKSQTKGIWAWCKVHPTQDNQILLLLDTEGLGDIKKGNVDHDNQLFSLALLLCSTLIYNLLGVFNQDALEKLSFITRLSEHVQVIGTNNNNEKEDDSLLRTISPLFILCLRDFYLAIDVGEQEPNPDQYFEDCLKPKNESESCIYNKTRECIIKYFQKRKCFTLSLPVAGKKLRHVDALDDSQLDEDFIQEFDKLRNFIFQQKQKMLDDYSQIIVDGTVFAQITTMYIDKLRNGSPIKYLDTFEVIAKHENKKIMKMVQADFEQDMEKITLPVKQKMILQSRYSENKEKALRKFRESAYPFRKMDFENKTSENIDKKYEQIKRQNRKLVKEDCSKVLCNLYEDMVEAHSEEYAKADGYTVYKRNMIALEREFNTKMEEVDNDERMDVWQNLKYSKHDENMRIYADSTKLDDEARYDAFRKDIEEQMGAKLDELLRTLSIERKVDLMKETKKLEEWLYSKMEKNHKATYAAIESVKGDKSKCIVM